MAEDFESFDFARSEMDPMATNQEEPRRIDPTMLNELQLDALREVTNIGCGAAATALSQLLGGRRINLEVTRSAILSFDELEALLGGSDSVRAAVHLTLRGGFEGWLLLAYQEADATRLAQFLAGAEADTEDPEHLSQLHESALMEVGNIVGSAFLNAVGKVSGMILLPSVPNLVHDRVARVVDTLRRDRAQLTSKPDVGSERMLVLETRLSAEGSPGVDGHVIIVPRPEALGVFLRAVGIDS